MIWHMYVLWQDYHSHLEMQPLPYMSMYPPDLMRLILGFFTWVNFSSMFISMPGLFYLAYAFQVHAC